VSRVLCATGFAGVGQHGVPWRPGRIDARESAPGEIAGADDDDGMGMIVWMQLWLPGVS
jgi:hypothetical protein